MSDSVSRLHHGHQSGSALPMALGCEQLGGFDWGNVDFVAVREAVRHAHRSGITVFDTADVYGLGRSERELCGALGAARHDVTIVTKGGWRWSTPTDSSRATMRRDASPRHLTSAIECSLQRLQIEAIPLYLLHTPDPAVPVEDSLSTLERARESGKIIQYGLSNFPIKEVLRLAREYPIAAVQAPCSLLDSPGLIADYRLARRSGVAVLAYGVLAQGFLTAKYSPLTHFSSTDRRHRLFQFSGESWRRHQELLRVLVAVAGECGRTAAQVAIRWVLDSGAANLVIVGARSPEQVTENLMALDCPLSESQLSRLDAVHRSAHHHEQITDERSSLPDSYR